MSTTNLYWKEFPVYKMEEGWRVHLVTEWESIEFIQLHSDIVERLAHINGSATLCPASYRSEGIYELRTARIVVFKGNSMWQDVNITAKNIDDLQELVVAIRNGLPPTYPLSRPQSAPSYEQLLATARNQSVALDRLTEQAETALRVLNAAQEMILQQGKEIAELRKLVAKANQKTA